MTEKTYLIDTCIWRDFYENRLGKTGRPIGAYATNLFMSIMKSKEKIIFSESLIWELKKDYSEQDIKDMLQILFLNDRLVKIEITKEEYHEGKKLSAEKNIPFIDCLNAVQARNHHAIMVSRDKHFIENLSDITTTVRPEDIR